MRPSLTSLAFVLALAPLPAFFAACSGSSSGANGGTPDGGGEAAAIGPDRHVVVLFTSDEHSHYFGFSPELDDYPLATAAGSGPLVGGVARRATVIKGLRKAADDAGKDSILVSSGDNQMGCLPMLGFSSASIDYGTMKALGYDATALGNHEFDFGPKALASSITAAVGKTAAPPIIASNIHFSSTDPGDDTLAALYGTGAGDKPIEPYRVVTTKSGVKVGLIGIVGINAAHVAPNKTPVTFSEAASSMVDGGTSDGDLPTNLPALYKDLQPVVDHLRNDLMVDLVVALSHSGIADVTTADGIAAGEDTGICQNVNGIDLVVSGHAHQHDPKPMQQMNASTMRPCLVLNGGAFGQEVGTVDFTIYGDPTKTPAWDTTTQKMVPVNEMVVPDATLAAQADGVIAQSEAANANGTTLAGLLGHGLGMTVTDNTAKAGDLYFMQVGATDFDITDPNARIWLSADAMLEESDALLADGTFPAASNTLVAVESQGVIRQILAKGKTGAISASDAFNVVPLGASPADGSLGYPLVRAYITLTELRGVLELSLGQGAKNSDYNLGLGGMSYEYDTTRPPITKGSDLTDPKKGMVTKISVDTNHADGYEQYDAVLYQNGVTSNFDSTLIPVITSSYIAQFAGDAGVKMKDSTGKPIAITDAIIKRKDNSEVKQVESFIRAIHAVPKLPSTYDTTSPSYTKRKICVKGC
jgi:2',3'-cyclic-nucleotide 2'-phosphodiesterase (5'-nucleotidase family)